MIPCITPVTLPGYVKHYFAYNSLYRARKILDQKKTKNSCGKPENVKRPHGR